MTAVSTSVLIALILVLGPIAWLIGWARAIQVSCGDRSKLHSTPSYTAGFAMLCTVLPALCFALLWAGVEQVSISRAVVSSLPANVRALPDAERSLAVGTVGSIAKGLQQLTPAELADTRMNTADVTVMLARKGVPLASPPPWYFVDAALRIVTLTASSRLIGLVISLSVAITGLVFALSLIEPAFRARNAVETVMRLGLAAASTVAIVTTVGIVFSMLFETLHFFSSVPLTNFFFGTVWDPRFSAAGRADSEGQFGVLPLLWGTLYISFVALLVAAPVGLFAAIYMAEYAGQRVRTLSKPLLELLSGIPTIVYGFFALITFGPQLRDLGELVGLSISASSVLTAGVIIGVMLIPFVSSLSDDIINAVPQSLRDGSYALGATKSETIKRVVLPAALPGIVGAMMLAASRAIGETMIVVLAAGIAPNLTLNPFEAVTTITVKIVSQLTGDLQFNSPQTLVSFALGLTLFVLTLGLNVYALYMVRKYHEQYE
jgi:phosphate transport system permease protein